MNSPRIALALAAGCCAAASAQSWDTTGNALLNGTYYFREVIISSSTAISLYGNIVFSGNGTYTITAKGYQCTTSCPSGNSDYQTTGTYSIAASGFGFITQNILNSQIVGSVGANHVFVGSATESGVYDLFIAAPVSGQNLGTLQGSYLMSYLETPVFVQVPFGALLQFSSNGNGAIGNVGVAAYATSSTPINQTISGVKYILSNNSYKMTFPSSNTNIITGDEYVYATPDGSFIFGGSPFDFDMFAGVRTVTGGTSTLDGLYYEAGMDFDDSGASAGNIGTDTYYGAFNAASSTIVGHQRVQTGGSAAYGYVYHDTFPAELGSTYMDIARSRQFIVDAGVRVGVGIGPFPALTVAVQAAKPTPSSGIFLDPTSALNTASGAPFTTGISSGELVTLNGAGLGPASLAIAFTTPLPTTLAGVQALVNNRPAPILYASATQIVIQVPFNTTTSIASIQVSYKGALSNPITTLVNKTTPGVFTLPIGGVNHASARHSNGTLVTPANPAKIGETISLYLTGLGDLTANVADGGAGPTGTPAKPTNTIAVFVGGIAVTPSFLALAPGIAGLYLMKLAIPAGVVTGDVFLDVSGPDSYSSQATLAVSSRTVGQVERRRPQGPSRSFRVPLAGARRGIEE